MTPHDDFFIPEQVDEQIELSSSPVAEKLQSHYQAEYLQNREYLERARRRIAAHELTHPETNQARSPLGAAPVLNFPQERTRTHMQHPSRTTGQTVGKKISRGLSLLAAAVIAGLLVGALALVLTFSGHTPGSLGSSSSRVTATPTTTPSPTSTSTQMGQVISTIHAPEGANLFPSVAWSPDSKHIAAMTTTGLEIWDAATGGNLKTIPLPANVDQVLWSPAGRYLAVFDLQTIVIVDSQTDSIVNTIHYQDSLAATRPATGQSPLASYAPLGSGSGFYSAAWTPNGASLAVAISSSTSGKVKFLDPLTGAFTNTFSVQTPSIGGSLAFSSDGQYLAASFVNDSKVIVWRVSTEAVVFQQNDLQISNLAWQPGTHNLARGAVWPVEVQLWDVDAKKLLKTYPKIEAFTWSPDGKELATYITPNNPGFSPSSGQPLKITLLNAATGAQIGLYTSRSTTVGAVSWSPDGRYIADEEATSTNENSQVVVWKAS